MAVVLGLTPPPGMNTQTGTQTAESIIQGHHRALRGNSDEGTGCVCVCVGALGQDDL